MTQTAINYAKALHELGISRETMACIEEIVRIVPKMQGILEAPVVSKAEKHQVIDQAFPAEARSFLKLLCDSGRAGQLLDICAAYEIEYKAKNHIVEAQVVSAAPVAEEKKQEIRSFIQQMYPDMDCQLSYNTDGKLLGGTVIKVGNMEYDNSYEGRLHQLELKLTGR